MTDLEALLSGEADEVAQLLFQVARRERAPEHARQRALSGVAAVSVGAALATGTKASLAASAGTAGGGVLAVKGLVVGLGVALLGLTAIDQVHQLLRPATVHPAQPPLAEVRAARPGTGAAAGGLPTPPELPAPTPAVSAASAKSFAVVPTAQAVVPLAPLAAPDAGASALALASPAAQLTREVAALRQARAALAGGQPAHALEVLAAYHRDVPVSVLGTEEAALHVEIAFALGEPQAAELAGRFLIEHPTSPLAQRIRALLDAKKPAGKKP